MSDIGTALRAHLLSVSQVTDLLGSRFYPDALQQGCELPAAVYYLISAVEEPSLSTRLEITHARIQIDCYASTRAAANGLAQLIRDQLDCHRGAWNSVDVLGVTVTSGLRYGVQQKADGGDERQYIASRDFLVSFRDP